MGRLAVIEMLSCLPHEELVRAEQNCRWRRYGKGERIVERASDNRDVYFVVEGAVEVVNFSLSGRPVAYADLSAGHFFGELAAIDGEPRSATVEAKTACLVGAMPPSHFISLMQRHPEISIYVMRRLAAIIRACDERIMDLSTLGAMQRILVELLNAAKPDPITEGSWMIYPSPPQRETAIRAATTRETVARVFTQLQEAGLIHRKGRTLYLRDRLEMERLAERLAPDPSSTYKELRTKPRYSEAHPL